VEKIMLLFAKKNVNLIERERKKVKYLHFAKKLQKKFTKLNLN